MNFTLPNVVMFGIGAILIYAAVKNKDPRDVVREAMGGKSAKSKGGPRVTAPGPLSPTLPEFGTPPPAQVTSV